VSPDCRYGKPRPDMAIKERLGDMSESLILSVAAQIAAAPSHRRPSTEVRSAGRASAPSLILEAFSLG